MTRQVPHGPEDLKCPLWRKPMSQVCHTCPNWVQVRGKHPQSLEDLDRWDCALALLPMLLIENSQRQMQTAAAVDKVANEVKQGNDQEMVMAVNRLRAQLPNAIRTLPGPPQALMIEQ